MFLSSFFLPSTSYLFFYCEIEKYLIITRTGSSKIKLPPCYYITLPFGNAIDCFVYALSNTTKVYAFLNLFKKTCSVLTDFFKKTLYGHTYRIKLVGRGYRLYKYQNLFFFRLGYPKTVSFLLPVGCYLRQKRRKVKFFKVHAKHLDKSYITSAINTIMFFRLPNVYSKKGFFIQHKKVTFKEGKKAFSL